MTILLISRYTNIFFTLCFLHIRLIFFFKDNNTNNIRRNMSSKSIEIRCQDRGNKIPSFFYKHQEIRFRSLLSSSFKRVPKQEYYISSNPWNSFKKDQINNLVERLEDSPKQLFKSI